MLFASQEVCIEKNCAQGLEPQAKGHTQDKITVKLKET